MIYTFKRVIKCEPMGECKSGQEGRLKEQKILELRSCEDAALHGASDHSFPQQMDQLEVKMTGTEDKAPTEPNSQQVPAFQLQRMLSLKSNENGAYPTCGSHIPGIALCRAMSHQETYFQQSQEEPIDVVKHELVTRSHSDHSGGKDHNIIEPFVDSWSHDTHLMTSDQSPRVRHNEEKMSIDGKKDLRASAQRSKKRKLRVTKWLSKRLHIHLPGSSPQVGHYCGPRIHPKNCCNVRKRT
ncbi:hypothetical protein GOP47_0016613 [Adiantum capillus-veneris]|uniref:Uncharacterized protein n=1 Tax=Adiantum capillus-veneris TaxID=13818 RepID=A0A9D4UIW9_ADICA|nr:hypothetical protein GOP47_0016613 [Adiantum capillus-veneris]